MQNLCRYQILSLKSFALVCCRSHSLSLMFGWLLFARQRKPHVLSSLQERIRQRCHKEIARCPRCEMDSAQRQWCHVLSTVWAPVPHCGFLDPVAWHCRIVPAVLLVLWRAAFRSFASGFLSKIFNALVRLALCHALARPVIAWQTIGHDKATSAPSLLHIPN